MDNPQTSKGMSCAEFGEWAYNHYILWNCWVHDENPIIFKNWQARSTPDGARMFAARDIQGKDRSLNFYPDDADPEKGWVIAQGGVSDPRPLLDHNGINLKDTVVHMPAYLKLLSQYKDLRLRYNLLVEDKAIGPQKRSLKKKDKDDK